MKRARLVRATAASALLLVVPSLAWVLFAPPAHARWKLPPRAQVASSRQVSPPSATARPSKRAHAEARATTDAPSAEVAPAPSIGGLVVDADGAPIANATVGCDDPDRDIEKVDTGPDGRFELPGAALGCKGVARHADAGRSSEVVLAAGDGNTLRIARSGGIEGSITGEHDEPFSSFWISVDSFVPADESAHGSADWHRFFAETDPPGSLVWRGLPPGRYVLVASVEGIGVAKSAPVDVAAGVTTKDVRIRVPKGETLFGVAIDARTHAPIAGARVGFWRENALAPLVQRGAIAGDDGKFELIATPREAFSIRAGRAGYPPKVFDGIASAGSDRAPIQLLLEPETKTER